MSLDSGIHQPRVIVLCFDGTSNQYDCQVSFFSRRVPQHHLTRFPEHERREILRSFGQMSSFRTDRLLPGPTVLPSQIDILAHTRPLIVQPGIGTFINPGVVSPLLEWLARTADLAIAWYGVKLEWSQDSPAQTFQVPERARPCRVQVPHAELPTG
jgi:hypothetical protein